MLAMEAQVSSSTRLAMAAGMTWALALAGPATARQPETGAALAAPRKAAAMLAAPGLLDLSSIAAGLGGFVIEGQSPGDWSGCSVDSAGDVNGDGLMDLIVGARQSAPGGRLTAGRSYVVFGKTATSATALSAVAAGLGGFTINGECRSDLSGFSVAGAGDLNGDGLADLVIGAWGSQAQLGPLTGRSYVVFGRTGTAAVELSDIVLGQGGFVINGQCAGDKSGLSVAAAGDVNGDGLADLIVGALEADTAAGVGAGRSYVLFGRAGTAAVDLSAVAQGSGGFVIQGGCTNERSGASVAGAGDVNGDGLADLVVGAPLGSPVGDVSGRSYVVFGRTASSAVELSAIADGRGGFVIDGQCAFDSSGSSVSGAGDVNGDGLADIVVGAYYSDPAAGRSAGRSYVVFGKAGTAAVALAGVAAGSGGFVINGECAGDWSGSRATAAGDINGDGLGDLLVGAYYSDPQGRFNAGRSYVVYGKTGTESVELAALASGEAGFVIDGQCRYDQSGYSLAGAADVNGDGLADLIVGAKYATPSSGRSAGRSYVVFGSTTGVFAHSAVDQWGGPADDRLTGSEAADVLVGGAGNDTLVGLGGADVLYGGAGDDVLDLTASNLETLRAAATGSRAARVDGGSGFDTLSLSGAGIVLDLGRVANQGGSTPASSSRLESIERFDLTGSGDNLLQAEVNDVQDIAGMNRINAQTQAALGWVNGSYRFAAVVQRHQVVVDGNAGDIVSSRRSHWRNAGTVSHDGVSYTVYNSTEGRAQVLVNDAVARTGLFATALKPAGGH